MTTDPRDKLELLQEELEFIEQGGYGRSVRTPWLPKSIFQDSLSCLNYAAPDRPHPCSECALIDFVEPEHQSESVPCHHIQMNESGATVEELDQSEDQQKVERLVRDWLRARISELESRGQ